MNDKKEVERLYKNTFYNFLQEAKKQSTTIDCEKVAIEKYSKFMVEKLTTLIESEREKVIDEIETWAEGATFQELSLLIDYQDLINKLASLRGK